MMRRLMNTRSTSRSFRCFSLTFDILKIIAKSQNAETNLLSHYTGTMLDNTQPTCRRCHHLSYQQQQQVFTILAKPVTRQTTTPNFCPINLSTPVGADYVKNITLVV